MIKNKKTKQIYIGQSTNIEKRFKVHCRALPVDVAIANEGVDNFDFIVLEEANSDDLQECEEYWIDYFDAYNNPKHYNQSSGCNLSDRALYTLWDTGYCNYQKNIKGGNKAFHFRYEGYKPPIGTFHDFISCEIIGDLIRKSI